MNYQRVSLIAAAFTVTVIACEHLGRLYQWPIRLSSLLGPAATFLRHTFEAGGKLFAWVSSFLTYIDLKDLGQTIYELAKPCYDIVVSPYYFFHGYVTQALTYLNKTYMIYIGSALLIGLTVYGLYKYRNSTLITYLSSPLTRLLATIKQRLHLSS